MESNYDGREGGAPVDVGLGLDRIYPLPPRLAEIAKDLPVDELAFDPVPVKRRRDGWSQERQRGFILRLALSGSIGASARAVGMTRRSAYDLREKPGSASFAEAWERAASLGVGSRADHALEYAIAGDVRPVFYKGRRCGEHVRFSHGLTVAVLNMAVRDQPHTRLAEHEAERILNDFLGASQ